MRRSIYFGVALSFVVSLVVVGCQTYQCTEPAYPAGPAPTYHVPLGPPVSVTPAPPTVRGMPATEKPMSLTQNQPSPLPPPSFVPSPVPPPPVPAPTVASQSARLTIANVWKTEAMLFTVNTKGELTFRGRVPAGSAIDVTTTTDERWAAVVQDQEPATQHHRVHAPSETWLLRPNRMQYRGGGSEFRSLGRDVSN